MSSTDRRRGSAERRRVHYRVGPRAYWSDLIFDSYKPVLVVSWRTIDHERTPYICFALDATQLRRHPTKPGEYIYDGDLLRTGRTTSPPPPWYESQAA